jgi:hypothetical protein
MVDFETPKPGLRVMWHVMADFDGSFLSAIVVSSKKKLIIWKGFSPLSALIIFFGDQRSPRISLPPIPFPNPINNINKSKKYLLFDSRGFRGIIY